MKLPLLRKYLIISLGFTALFLVLSFFIIQLFFQLHRRNFVHHPPQFNAWVFDANGRVSGSSTNRPLPFKLSKVTLPNGTESTAFWRHKPPIIIEKLTDKNTMYIALSPRWPHVLSKHSRSLEKRSHPPYHRPILLFAFAIVSAFLLGSALSAIVLLKKLFDELKSKEKSRTRLLQELAHDLRTPIASMQNNLSLLSDEQGRLAEDSKRELVVTSQKEANYIETLVNDLLLMSQLAGADTDISKTSVDVTEIIEDELEVFDTQQLKTKTMLQVRNNAPATPAIVNGNALLLKRVFRNLLQNAFSFARNEITIDYKLGDHVEVFVNDDGPGFSAQALKDYGERRTTRFIDAKAGGRISVGLGSVVVKTIAQLHDGKVIPSNRLGKNGEVIGASVRAIFKRANQS